MMMKRTLLSLAAAALLDSAVAADHNVTVGKGGVLKFEPESLTAQVGDTITYRFFSKNHAVARSSFFEPCQVPDDDDEPFFFSGFVPTTSTTVAADTTFTVKVNDTKPIWVYCPQTNGDHCQKGMVQAINAPVTGNTLDAFKVKASKAPQSTTPKNGLPVGGNRVLHIEVGQAGKLLFTPNNVQELPGTVVQFTVNPKNHTVTESSFAKPCEQLQGGFSSGFVPTAVSPSGATFDVVINDTKPIWFYCAQTTGNHCQTGMVGSINAPATGNTFQAYKDAAAKVKISTIAPIAPIGGTLVVNGTTVLTSAGNVYNSGGSVSDTGGSDKGDKGDAGTSPSDWVKNVPKPGENDQYMMDMAGGGVIAQYDWGKNISDSTVQHLQLLQWFDNILLEALLQGYNELKTGDWSGAWPITIVETIGAMAAQAYIHRSTATDTLQHYSKNLTAVCKYDLPFSTIDDFLDLVLKVLLLELGLQLDIIGSLLNTDSWLIPAVASSIGSNGRMAAVVNLMQNHIAAPAPREVAIPAEFVYSYASNNWIGSCPSEPKGWGSVLEPLKVKSSTQTSDKKRLATVTFDFDRKAYSKTQLFVAFLGPWGAIHFSSLSADNVAAIPNDLYGHVWAVIVKKTSATLDNLYGISVAGPELVWVSQP